MKYIFNEQSTKTYKAKQGFNDKHWYEGYYVLHNTRQICPIGDFKKEGDFKHLIIKDSFADWNMPRNLESVEIDINTLCKHTGYFCDGKGFYEKDFVCFNSNHESIKKNIGIIKYGEYTNPFETFKDVKHFGFYVEWLKGDNVKTLRKDFVGLMEGGFLIHTNKNSVDNPDFLSDKGEYNE